MSATKIPPLLEALTAEIRDVAEGIYGRPTKRRGVTTVISEVVSSEDRLGWIAKVKFGSAVLAKTRRAHFTIEGALADLRDETKKALGIRS